MSRINSITFAHLKYCYKIFACQLLYPFYLSLQISQNFLSKEEALIIYNIDKLQNSAKKVCRLQQILNGISTHVSKILAH